MRNEALREQKEIKPELMKHSILDEMQNNFA